jgi:glucokinase
VASGRAIARAYNERVRPAVAWTAKEVGSAAAHGDAIASLVWDGACEALAESLATCSILLDPETIVLGGGLSLAGPQLLEPVARSLARRLPLPGHPTIRAARLGDRGALEGAALAARQLLRGTRGRR